MKKLSGITAAVLAVFIAAAMLNGCAKQDTPAGGAEPQNEENEAGTPISEEASPEISDAEQQIAELWQDKSEITDNSMTVTLTVGSDPDSFTGFFGADKTDFNFDLFWTVETDPDTRVTLTFYPAQFGTQMTLRQSLYNALCGLPIPSAIDNYEFTNTPEVREAVGKVFSVTINGNAVSGDLYHSQGNGHVDFIFKADDEFALKTDDVISITVSAAEWQSGAETID